MNKYKVLIVDDDEFVCEDIATSLDESKFDIDKAYNGETAFEIFKQKIHNIVITDLEMNKNKEAGFFLLEKIKSHSPSAAVMIITGHSDIHLAIKAMQNGALDYVTKPYDAEQIAIKVVKIADRVALSDENIRLRNEISSQYAILGNSATIQELKKHISIIAKTESRVLITGPNGSGKELVARAIRDQSNRAEKPFEVVNCAALPENLIESELFGTVKGAFTGANDKKGKFELANEGTIFLDEVGDMTLATQAKVLRVLENGEFTRVGSERQIKVNVRVIAATNKDLSELIKKGLFREDLFYRLNVIPIHTTPLRLRVDDVPTLIEHKINKMGKALDISKVFDVEAIKFLQSLEWEGNVRELNNVIERLMIFWNGQPLGTQDIKPHISGNVSNKTIVTNTSKSLKEATNDFEREYIQKVLEECEGNITDTANRLDLQRPYLYEKMSKLGIKKGTVRQMYEGY